jgi:hypothetical protein
MASDKKQAVGSHSARKPRAELTAVMRTSISQVMQYALLDEILGAGSWRADDLVFQGGTSIHLVWNSPRYSEDLDFMISVDRCDQIGRVMERASRGVRNRIMMLMPDSEIRLKPPSRPSGEVGSLLKYELVWSDPQTMGSVRVKAEFYTVKPEHLEAYRREARRHAPDAMTAAVRDIGMDPGDMIVRSIIPAAHPESIYGDKLVAIARRPYLKPRDFFDLWWLHTQLGTDIADERLYDVVRRSADCYTCTDDDLVSGLHQIMQHPPSLAGIIEENLAAFLPQTLHRRMSEKGTFGAMYRHAMAESDRLCTAILSRPDPSLTVPGGLEESADVEQTEGNDADVRAPEMTP